MHAGLAHLCLITGHMTVIRSKIEKSIPRKHSGGSGHGKAMKSFFEQMLQAIIRHVRFDVVKCILIASPGFIKVRRVSCVCVCRACVFVLCVCVCVCACVCVFSVSWGCACVCG